MSAATSIEVSFPAAGQFGTPDFWGECPEAVKVVWEATVVAPEKLVVCVTAYTSMHRNHSWYDPRYFVADGLDKTDLPAWVPPAPAWFWVAVEEMAATVGASAWLKQLPPWEPGSADASESWESLAEMAAETRARTEAVLQHLKVEKPASETESSEEPLVVSFDDLDPVGKIDAGLRELLEQSDECGQGVAVWVKDYVWDFSDRWRRDHPVAQQCARTCKRFCNSLDAGSRVRPGLVSHDGPSCSSVGGTSEGTARRESPAPGVPVTPVPGEVS